MKETDKSALLASGMWLLRTGTLLVGVALLIFLLFEGLSKATTLLLFLAIIVMEIVGVILVIKAENMP